MQRFLTITKALSDETRLRALMLLAGGELCLCQIIDVLQLAPATVSKHMAVLHQAGLVRRRKAGRWHFYRWADDSDEAVVRDALAWVRDSVGEERAVTADCETLCGVREKPLEVLAACYRR